MRPTRLLILGLAGLMAASLAASAQGAQQTGTSAIRGRVFAADAKRPLRRARITVTGGLGGEPRAASTNAEMAGRSRRSSRTAGTSATRPLTCALETR